MVTNLEIQYKNIGNLNYFWAEKKKIKLTTSKDKNKTWRISNLWQKHDIIQEMTKK